MFYSKYEMTWVRICEKHGWDVYNDCPGYFRERGELSDEEDKELFEAWEADYENDN